MHCSGCMTMFPNWTRLLLHSAAHKFYSNSVVSRQAGLLHCLRFWIRTGSSGQTAGAWLMLFGGTGAIHLRLGPWIEVGGWHGFVRMRRDLTGYGKQFNLFSRTLLVGSCVAQMFVKPS